MAKLIDITGKAKAGEWGSESADGKGIPVLRTTNFTNSGDVDYSDVVIRDLGTKNVEEKKLRKGDIIIEKSGGSDKQPVGRVIYFEGPDSTFLFNNFTGLLRIHDQRIWFPKYVFYALYSNYHRGGTVAFENKTTGLHNLQTDSYVNRTEIPDRPFDSQRRICEKLDALKRTIEARNKQIVLFDNLIKARFVEMFGDPIRNPYNWNNVKLRNTTSKIGSGATPKGGKGSYQSGGITLIRSMNVHDGKFEYKDLAHISDNQAAQLDNVTVEENDVFINITGASVARSCIVPKEVLPARVNQHVAIIRCIDRLLNPIFANNLFLNDSFKRILLNIGESNGATRQAITKQQLENLDVIIPPLILQQRFATFVSHVDKSKVDGVIIVCLQVFAFRCTFKY